VLREYEFTIITNPQLQEADTSALVDKYEKLITKDGGTVIRKKVWGTRKLAYSIGPYYRGNYVHYDLIGDPANLAEANRLMRIDNDVLRSLAIKIGEDVDADARKVELAKEEARAAAHRDRERTEAARDV